MDVSTKVSMLDEQFSQYIMKKISDSELEKALATVLTGLSNNTKDFFVTIVHNGTKKEPFFGMRIFPVATAIDSILKEMMAPQRISLTKIVDRWKGLKNWLVEIDSNCLDRNEISFTPEELTAMLLHELGHTIYSGDVIERLYRADIEVANRMEMADRKADKILYFLYSIPTVTACKIRDWRLDKYELKQELFADATVENLGYGEPLVSALRKIIKAYGNSNTSDDHAKDETVKASIEWCAINATELVTRKNNLKDELYYNAVKTESGFLKGIAYGIMKKIGLTTRERYTGAAVESSITMFEDKDFLQTYSLVYDIKTFGFIENARNDAYNRACTALESMSSSKKKLDIPTQLDIDSISIEIDRITNHMDRRYVLDLIYNQIERIANIRAMFPYDENLEKTYGSKFDRMETELNSMNKVVLSKRDFDKQYKVFVKYPTGYEG